jgi:type IV secretion system protein VirB6
MISIAILGILAPLFVPLYLFDYTKGYFEAWVKLLISFLLQPMVAVVFMTTMLSVYDFGFYGTCKYTNKDITYSGSEFKLNVHNNGAQNSVGENSRTVRYSYLDQDWEHYSDDEKKSCQDSLGFILNNPYQFLYNTGDDLLTDAKMPWIEDASGKEEKKRFNFLDSIENSPGMFFGMVEVMFEKIKTLVLAMLTACLVLYLMYHFSESLAEFAADMTEGVALSNMTIKPQAIFKAGMAALGAAGGATGGGEGGGGADKMSTGRGGASDKMSTGDGKSSDKMSTGDSGGASDKMSTGDRGGASDKMSIGGGKLAEKIQGSSDKVGTGIKSSDSVRSSVKGEESNRNSLVKSGKSENEK